MKWPFVARSAFEFACDELHEREQRIADLELKVERLYDHLLVNAGKLPVHEPERQRAGRATPRRVSIDVLGARLEKESRERASGIPDMLGAVARGRAQ
jgi:hypothetical protein